MSKAQGSQVAKWGLEPFSSICSFCQGRTEFTRTSHLIEEEMFRFFLITAPSLDVLIL